MVLDSQVYDLSSFLLQHPGGPKILLDKVWACVLLIQPPSADLTCHTATVFVREYLCVAVV